MGGGGPAGVAALRPLVLGLAGLLLAYRLFKMLKTTGVELFLRNLTYFFTAEGSTAAAGAATAKAKKPAAKAAGMQAGGQVVFVDWFTGPVLHQLPSSDEVELMVVFGLALLLCTAIILGISLATGTFYGSIATVYIFLIITFSLFSRLKVDFSKDLDRASKAVLVIVAVVGWAMSLACMTGYGPAKLLGFGIDQAVETANTGLSMLGARAAEYLGLAPEEEVPFSIGPMRLALALSAWSGLLAAAMMRPGVRYAGLLYHATNMPSVVAQHASHSRAAVAVMQAGFAIPLAAVMVQIKPIAHLWGLDEHSAQLVFAVLLLLTAALHVVALRPMCQAYLNVGLLDWFKYSHNGHDFQSKKEVLTRHLLSIMVGTCKAAAELLVLAFLTLSQGLVLLLHAWGAWQQAGGAGGGGEGVEAGHGGGAGGAGAGAGSGGSRGGLAAGEGIGDLWVFVARFFGWWACLVWCVSAYLTMLVSRLGLHAG